MPEYIRYDDGNFLGMHVNSAAAQMLEKANATGANYSLSFNGCDVLAHPGDTTEGIVADWDKRRDEAHAIWKASPEGQEYYRQEAIRKAERAAEIERRREYWRNNPVEPFALKDADGWAQCVAANSDGGYGEYALNYARQWACMMERDIAAGMTVAETATLRQHEADAEMQMSGFQWGCALSILTQVWEHGDELREWREAEKRRPYLPAASTPGEGEVQDG